MPPQLALLLFTIGTLGLFYLDRERESRVSPFLWLPVLWLSLGGSRNVSLWLGMGSPADAMSAQLDGSPLDRAVLSLAIAISIAVLATRSDRVWPILKGNAPLLLFFAYCLLSAAWSDYPVVTLKRWSKALGNVTMVLLVLTELDVAMAVKKLISRTAFILMPASVLFIRYYPYLGRYYDQFEGRVFYSGVTADKNQLGCICMILGIGLICLIIDQLRNPVDRRRHLTALGIVFAITVTLLLITDSSTSLACFLLGGGVMAFVGFTRPKPALVHVLVLSIAVVSTAAFLLKDFFAVVAGSLGRDTTLTGRTELWDTLLQMDFNRLTGTGFESFFLGDRLDFLWKKYWWRPTEAHNGYLETYLTLGMIGLGLLAMLMFAGYLNAMRVYKADKTAGALRLSWLMVSPVYNITEAAFKVMNPMWILFLLASTRIAAAQVQDASREQADEAKLSHSEPLHRP
jgi:O-antigen ligase